MTMIDPKGRQAAIEAANEMAIDGAPVPDYVDAIIRAYLSTIKPAEAGGLVERLEYHVGNPSAWDSYDEGASELIREAATSLASERAAHAETKRELADYQRATSTFDAHETANVSDKPEGQQEPVAWQRRVKFPKAPGAKPQWEQCSAGEANDHFARRPGCEYRPLYTRPSEQAVTDKMVGVANSAFVEAFSNGGALFKGAIISGVNFDFCMRAAIKAAMEAGR